MCYCCWENIKDKNRVEFQLANTVVTREIQNKQIKYYTCCNIKRFLWFLWSHIHHLLMIYISNTIFLFSKSDWRYKLFLFDEKTKPPGNPSGQYRTYLSLYDSLSFFLLERLNSFLNSLSVSRSISDLAFSISRYFFTASICFINSELLGSK